MNNSLGKLAGEIISQIQQTTVDMDAGKCFASAVIAKEILNDHHVEVNVVAGSASFLVAPEKDKEEIRYLTYAFDEPSIAEFNPEETMLPDMHIWLKMNKCVIGTGGIIDFSIWDLPRMAAIHNLEWTQERPRFFWSNIPDWASYVENKKATEFINNLIYDLT